jgi:CheY-like chemotaxis protein
VLVADDDPELLGAVSDALTHLGADVTRAVDGAELIEVLAGKGPFDLIVTDISMPWMTGIQAVHAVRRAGLGTSVLIMTAMRDETIAARVNALGGNVALLQKPFTLAELESAASTLLEQAGDKPKSRDNRGEGSREVAP